ncbi:hypothetical protein FSP39_023973 [Pinctada imbricata]|uniref:L-Fucosyltransferase n=1 Tax=Pinctada imbricata TaxID=66713 RepID=A0AA89C9I1_PINIB|nr:hypothetical protein FSP39_023973 [Pinctada imbricata]
MVKKGYFDLHDIFLLEGDELMTDSSFDPSYCSCLPYKEDKYNCGYDDELYALPKGKDVYFYGYFQSWRYLLHHEDTIRRLFTFKEEIRNTVQNKLREMLYGTSWNYRTDHLVGVHIRRGDHLNRSIKRFGKKIPSADYITKAMEHMNKLHGQGQGKVRFIVCSDDITWSREHLTGFSEVYFSDAKTPVEDLAMLSMTNHTIITVGTFGWWAAFLSNGTTIYFKDLFVQNSDFAAEFRDNSVGDFFPPSWIGME